MQIVSTLTDRIACLKQRVGTLEELRQPLAFVIRGHNRSVCDALKVGS
jgi:hypothetical protein